MRRFVRQVTRIGENNGSMTANMEKFTEINSDFLLTAKGNWDRFGIVGTVGGNMMYRNSTWYKESSGEFVIPDFHAIATVRHMVVSILATVNKSTRYMLRHHCLGTTICIWT